MRDRAVTTVGVLLLASGVSACGPSVSNHDNRIFSMTASSKLSATELAAGYAADRATTDDLYRGKVLEVSGTIASVDQASNTIVMAGSDQAVWASLHEDVAADVLKAAAQGQRITLKCFCEGLETQVHLKSCVPPDSGR